VEEGEKFKIKKRINVEFAIFSPCSWALWWKIIHIETLLIGFGT